MATYYWCSLVLAHLPQPTCLWHFFPRSRKQIMKFISESNMENILHTVNFRLVTFQMQFKALIVIFKALQSCEGILNIKPCLNKVNSFQVLSFHVCHLTGPWKELTTLSFHKDSVNYVLLGFRKAFDPLIPPGLGGDDAVTDSGIARRQPRTFWD